MGFFGLLGFWLGVLGSGFQGFRVSWFRGFEVSGFRKGRGTSQARHPRGRRRREQLIT